MPTLPDPERTVCLLDEADWEAFQRLIDEPPKPTPKLADLLARPSVFDC